MSYKYIIIVFVLLFLCNILYSQEYRTVRLKQYTQNDGLSSHYVTKIHQDQYGFLWVGTQEGLNLFDGVSFQKFSNQSVAKRNIGGALVQDLVEDIDQSILWVLTAYSDICAIDLKSRTIIKRISTDHNGKSFSEQWIRCFYLANNILWVGGLNSLSAYDIHTDSFLDVSEIEKDIQNKGELNFSRIIDDKLGRIWLLNEGGGIKVVDKNLNIVTSFDLQEYEGRNGQKLLFWDVARSRNEIYIASNWGLLHFNSGNSGTKPVLAVDVPPPLSSSEVRSVESTSESKLLAATANHLYEIDLNKRDIVKVEDENREKSGLSSVFQIYYDDEADLVWVGTQEGLNSFIFGDGPFTSYSRTRSGNQKIKNLYALQPVSDSVLYAGGDNGTFHINLNTREVINIDSTSANLLLFQDQEKNLFLSNSQGFKVIKNNQVIQASELSPELKLLDKDYFSCAVQYNDSLILFGSVIQKGLSIWNNRSGEITTYHSDSLDHRIPDLSIINYLFKGTEDNVFILTEKSIIRFNPLTKDFSSHIVKNENSNKIIGNFMDMHELGDSFFLATYGNGLVETDKKFNIKTIFTTASGLSNDCIYRIFPLDDNSIIATSNNGISVISRGNSNSIRTYYHGDGLHGNGFEQLCGFMKGERIFAGGSGGFTIVNTQQLNHRATSPKLYLRDIKMTTRSGKTDSSDLFMKRHTIPNNVLQTTVSFTGLNYRNPGKVTYQYKIEELGNKWIDIGNQNFVDLLGISPGNYTVKFKAFNAEGSESIQREIILEFLPKWYQTNWFKLILFLIVATLIYLLQRYRISQIKRQQQIRKEIANDLHDDIGSTLNSLKIFTHIAQYEPENHEHLVQIENSITNATEGLRDMIWVLEDEQDSTYELVERIRKFAFPICQANDIEFESEVNATTNRMISKNLKRNLFLIGKEAINNSIKHASCTKISVLLEHTRTNLKLIIQDDGLGFDITTITLGKGLESIKYRARQIHFDCKIQSQYGCGTKIEINGNKN